MTVAGLLAVAALMSVAFAMAETRAAEPIIGPGLFKNDTCTVSVSATFLAAGGMFGAILFLPLFVQGVIGQTATNAGTVLTPMMLGFVVSSGVGGQIMARTGRYKALALYGFATAAAGMALLASMDAGTTSGVVVRNIVITGLGTSVTLSLFAIVVQHAFPWGRLGEVTASLQFCRAIGRTIGVAVLGTVMTNRFQDALAARLPPRCWRSVSLSRVSCLRSRCAGATACWSRPQSWSYP